MLLYEELNYLSKSMDNQLKDLNIFDSYEEGQNLNLLDKIEIHYNNNLSVLDVYTNRLVLKYLEQHVHQKEMYGFYKMMLEINSFWFIY